MKFSPSIPSCSNENFCFHVGDYSFGFNGQEKEKQITGADTHTSAEFWMYDSRAGRRWNVDPILKYHMSAYSCLSDNPINRIDVKGNTDDKANSNNPNDPNKKGGKEKFHKESTELRKDQQKKINEKEITTLPKEGASPLNFEPNEGENPELRTPESEFNIASQTEKTSQKGFTFGIDITANITAAVGISGSAEGIGGNYDAGSVVFIGFDDNEFYFCGDKLSDDEGREVNKGYSLQAPLLSKNSLTEDASTVGFNYKQTLSGSRNGKVLLEKTTARNFIFIYTEKVEDHRNNTVTSTTGLSYDFSIGLGLIWNFGIKIPLYVE